MSAGVECGSRRAAAHLLAVKDVVVHCVAALRYVIFLNAARDTLNRFCRGGQRAVRGQGRGQPNNSFERSGDSGAFIRETRRLDAARAPPAQFER